MIHALMTVVIVLSAGGMIASPRVVPAAKVDAGEFIYRSVLDGLAADGVPPALAATLAKNDDFLKKCGICGMTRKAMSVHGELKNAPVAKAGRGLRDDLVKRLMSKDDAVRRVALRELIQRYIDFGYAGLDVAVEQKQALQAELELMRKNAVGGLEKGQKYCPSCDGACRLTPKI